MALNYERTTYIENADVYMIEMMDNCHVELIKLADIMEIQNAEVSFEQVGSNIREIILKVNRSAICKYVIKKIIDEQGQKVETKFLDLRECR